MSEIKATKRNITIIEDEDSSKYITSKDAAMDARAKQAVKAAVSKAAFCQKPVAKYDAKNKKAYLQYSDGRRVDVK